MQDELYSFLECIYQRQSLTQEQSYRLFSALLNGEFDKENIAALLVAIKMKGESTSEVAGAAAAMRDSALAFNTPDYAFSDMVGTGGDGHNTINISSAASVVAASCGIKVAKHGNRSVSSKSGSSDLFAGFGLNLEVSPTLARKCLDESNLCYLAAPQYHTGMKYVMPIRLKLKTRTLFNVLGPLANPASPTHGIYGVYSADLLDIYANTLLAMGHNNAFVVHGSGLDEIALHGVTKVRRVRDGKVEAFELSPSDFGAKEYPLSAIEGGSPEQNVEAIKNVFTGKGEPAHTLAIGINAAALLYLHDDSIGLNQHLDTVMESMASSKPMQTITQCAAISQGAH